MHFSTSHSLNPVTHSPTLCHIRYNKVEVSQMHFYSFLLNDMVSTMILECCDSTLLRNTYWTLPENSHPTWEVKRPKNFKKTSFIMEHTSAPSSFWRFQPILFREHMEMGNTFKIWVPRPLCIQDLTHPTISQNFDDTSGKRLWYLLNMDKQVVTFYQGVLFMVAAVLVCCSHPESVP